MRTEPARRRVEMQAMQQVTVRYENHNPYGMMSEGEVESRKQSVKAFVAACERGDVATGVYSTQFPTASQWGYFVGVEEAERVIAERSYGVVVEVAP